MNQDNRSNFMVPKFLDPIKKREEFSISLRKVKKQMIIQSKRKRIIEENKRNTEMTE
jgi:hypothetical protein